MVRLTYDFTFADFKTPAQVTLYRLQNSKHFYPSYRERQRHMKQNGLTGRTLVLNEPEEALWCSMF